MPIVTTSTGEQELIARNRLRKSLLFKNEDSAIAVYIRRARIGDPVVSSTFHDFRLDAGESFSLVENEDGKEAVQDRFVVIAASSTPIVSWFETEDVIR